MEIVQIAGVIAGLIAVVVGTVGATFFALVKWGFVLKESCKQYRDECHYACANIKTKALEAKLDSICASVRKLHESLQKDQDRYIELREFVGKVEQYMEMNR